MGHEILASLIVSPTNTDQWVTIEPFSYQASSGVFYTVPQGYVTKGNETSSSWGYEQESNSQTLPAMIMHDYLCSTGQCTLGEHVMNEILKKTTKNIEVKVIYGQRVKKRKPSSILKWLRGRQ